MSITFQYRVRDSLGKIVDGQLDADGPDEASLVLRRQGFTVIEIDERDDGGLFPRRVTKGEIVYMTSQLAVMVDTASRFPRRWKGSRRKRRIPPFAASSRI